MSGKQPSGSIPKVVRTLLRDLLESQGVFELQAILTDPQATREQKLKAIDLCGKYGLGTRVDTTFEDGEGRTGIVYLPVQDGAVVPPATNGRSNGNRQQQEIVR